MENKTINGQTTVTTARDNTQQPYCLSQFSNQQRQQGMTLLELVVVIALLGIIALASTSLIVDTGEYKKQQATEDKWLSIRRAILGDNNVDVTGRREYAGFVTDMGRLPNCLRELVRPYACEQSIDNATPLPQFTQDTDSYQWSGWRGPYVSIPGTKEFRDGWLNEGTERSTANATDTQLFYDDVNYGWLFGTGADDTLCSEASVVQKQAGTIILQSCSDDGKVTPEGSGGDVDRNFTTDYPYVEIDDVTNDRTYTPLITRHDYQVALDDNWLSTPIKIITTTNGSAKIIPADELRLRLNYPVNGEITDYADITTVKEAAPFLSETFPANDTRLADATGTIYNTGTNDILVPTGTALSGTTLEVPASVSPTLTFDDNSGATSEFILQDCPCELEITASANPLSGTTLSGTTSIKVTSENIAPLNVDLGKYWIELPAGVEFTGTSTTLPNGTTLTLSAVPLDTTNYLPKVILPSGTTVTFSGSLDIFDGDLVTIDTGNTGDARFDQFLVPSSSSQISANVISIDKSIPPIPVGVRSLTVVCDGGTVPGDLYDGDCTDALPNNAIETPYPIAVSPRSYVPLPDAIIWDIE